jgi:ABC-2 type transport system ATP-binding protein
MVYKKKEKDVIKIEQVSKNFVDIKALQENDLEIEKGELFGLLGPNGAGKTTLINILSTFLSPTSGQVTMAGLSLAQNKDKIKKIIGIVPQEIALYQELTAKENLFFWGSVYGLKKAELKERVEDILQMVGLFQRRDDTLKNYSGGMKRRINIAAGLLHNPEIILLDEPTVGVDPQSRNFIFEMIESLNNAGKTIIYTTHYMEEAERLCDRIAIIDKGKIIAQGSKQDLYRILDYQSSITLKLKHSPQLSQLQIAFPEYGLKLLNNRTLWISHQQVLNQITAIIQYIGSANIVEIDFDKPNLEKVFLQLTGRELRDD